MDLQRQEFWLHRIRQARAANRPLEVTQQEVRELRNAFPAMVALPREWAPFGQSSHWPVVIVEPHPLDGSVVDG
jgi:hypothetical protein